MKAGPADMHSLKSVTMMKLPVHYSSNGDLVVMEGGGQVPFVIARVFVVVAPAGAIRGQHAHKRCTQFVTCPRGAVEVLCDDGIEETKFILDQPGLGLLILPSIWAQQTYQAPGSVLTVLCDRPYEPTDYIRDYAEFLDYRKMAGGHEGIIETP